VHAPAARLKNHYWKRSPRLPIYSTRGVQHYRENNCARAINDFENAVLQYRSIDDRTGIATSCLNLTNSYLAINNDNTATTYLMTANTVIEQESLIEL